MNIKEYIFRYIILRIYNQEIKDYTIFIYNSGYDHGKKAKQDSDYEWYTRRDRV
jgi:hypothetical protein